MGPLSAVLQKQGPRRKACMQGAHGRALKQLEASCEQHLHYSFAPYLNTPSQAASYYLTLDPWLYIHTVKCCAACRDTVATVANAAAGAADYGLHPTTFNSTDGSTQITDRNTLAPPGSYLLSCKDGEALHKCAVALLGGLQLAVPRLRGLHNIDEQVDVGDNHGSVPWEELHPAFDYDLRLLSSRVVQNFVMRIGPLAANAGHDLHLRVVERDGAGREEWHAKDKDGVAD